MCKIAEDRRVKWRLPVAVAAMALLIEVMLVAISLDLGCAAAIFVVTPISTVALIVLIVGQNRGTKLARCAIFACYGIASWLLLSHPEQARSPLRWLFESKTWKAEVMRQPVSPDGMMRHAEWDGWGFAGAGDTEVYLVFDPNDSLRDSGRRHLQHFRGLPCDVYEVSRMESHWYAVTFYTDTTWDSCSGQ